MENIETLCFLSTLMYSVSCIPTSHTRNLMQVYDMLEEETNCTFLELLSLTDYGNWCGLGNNGKVPVDIMDKCCKVFNLETFYNSKTSLNYQIRRGGWPNWEFPPIFLYFTFDASPKFSELS